MHKTTLCKIQFLPWTGFKNISEPLQFYQKMKVQIRSELSTKTGAPESYQTGNASSILSPFLSIFSKKILGQFSCLFSIFRCV